MKWVTLIAICLLLVSLGSADFRDREVDGVLAADSFGLRVWVSDGCLSNELFLDTRVEVLDAGQIVKRNIRHFGEYTGVGCLRLKVSRRDHALTSLDDSLSQLESFKTSIEYGDVGVSVVSEGPVGTSSGRHATVFSASIDDDVVAVEHSESLDVGRERLRVIKSKALILRWVVGDVKVKVSGTVCVFSKVVLVLQLVHGDPELVEVFGLVLGDIWLWLESPRGIQKADILEKCVLKGSNQRHSLQSSEPPIWARRSFRQPCFELVENR